MKKLNKNNKGFSLVELLVVIAIMVVLVGVVAPTLLNNIEKSKESKDVQALDSIASAVQSALADESAYDIANESTGKYYNKSVLASEIIGEDTDAFTKKVTEYLKTLPEMSGSTAHATGNNIYVLYTADGRVCVYVASSAFTPTTAKPLPETSDVITGKRGQTYIVTR